MTLRQTAFAVFAVLTLMVGTGAALPADAQTDGEGPPSSLPSPVPDFVTDVLTTISSFLDGAVGTPGGSVSDTATGG